jgi:hypothetical protein
MNSANFESFTSGSRGSGATGSGHVAPIHVNGSVHSSGFSHSTYSHGNPRDNTHLSAHYRDHDTTNHNYFGGFNKRGNATHFGKGINKNKFRVDGWEGRHGYRGGWWGAYPYWWYWLSYYPGYYYYDDIHYYYYDPVDGSIVYSNELPYDYIYTELPTNYSLYMPQQHGDENIVSPQVTLEPTPQLTLKPTQQPTVRPIKRSVTSRNEEMQLELSDDNSAFYYIIILIIIVFVIAYMNRKKN